MLYKSLTSKERVRLMTDEELKGVIGDSGCRPDDTLSNYFDMLPEERRLLVYSVIELYERDRTEKRKCPHIGTSDDAYRYIRHIAVNNDKEEVHIIGLDASNNAIIKRRISVGTMYTCKFSVAEIIREAAINKCFGFILAHNHPSGFAKPSTEDNKLTAELKTACDLVGLSLLDHLIVTTKGYYSYRSEGKL